jgi:hypothetical protein
VKIYVPDEITMQEQAAQFLAGALPGAAGLVRSRLRRRAPTGQPTISLPNLSASPPYWTRRRSNQRPARRTTRQA